jgi:hypothetical protein
LTEHFKEQGFKDSDIVVCSADDFFNKRCEFGVSDKAFRDRDGNLVEYRFNPAKLGEAHAQCLSTFIGAVADKKPVVIVDNTNIKMWEWRNYAMIAKSHGYEIQIQEFVVETVEQIREVARRNVHSVPADIVYRMCVEFEPCANAVRHIVFPEK